jgi:hypothetical protein
LVVITRDLRVKRLPFISTALSDTLKNLYLEADNMFPILETGVQPGVINAAGLIVGLGGIALTIGWLNYLYR